MTFHPLALSFLEYRTVKYNDASSVFVEVLMTNAAIDCLARNYLFKGWAEKRDVRVPGEMVRCALTEGSQQWGWGWGVVVMLSGVGVWL